MIDIIKDLNGDVNIYDTVSSDLLATYPSKVSKIYVDERDNVIVLLKNGEAELFDKFNIASTQILPAAAVAFGPVTSQNLIGILKQMFNSVDPVGQKDMAESISVTIASDQSAIPISGSISTTSVGRVKSTLNSASSTITINNGATWTGTAETSDYTAIAFSGFITQSCALYIDFSHDGTNWDSSLPYTIAGNFNEVHRLVNTKTYFRIRIVNNSGSNASARFETFKGEFGILTSPLNGTIQSDSDSIVTRSIIVGQTGNGLFKFVPVTAEGHLEVALHAPRLPFGSIHTENLTPIFQSDAVYLIDPNQEKTTVSGSGSATVDDSSFKASTGTTIYSQGIIQSRKRLRYRAGQGVVGKFAGYFTAPQPYSYQLMGYGHAEDGVYFGYADIAGVTPEFGILYVNRGVREQKTLTVTAGATGAGNVTITLNGTAYTVALSGGSNVYKTAWEISIATYAGWDAYALGATVVFLKASSGVTAGTQTFAAGGTGATATIVQTKAGVRSTDVFIPQSTWNGDRLDGTGSIYNPSGVLLNPQKGNVFQIKIQYLGYGTLLFEIEVVDSTGNNADFVTVHTIKNPNTLTKTTFGNPSFPFTMAAYSAGSTTDLTVRAGSYSGYIEGSKVLHGPRMSYVNQSTAVNNTTFTPLFTIQNKLTYAGRANQAVINLLSVTGAVKHTQPVIYYLIRNGALQGNPNFIDKATNSCAAWDTAATGVTFATDESLIWSGHLGETGDFDHHFGNGEFNAEEVTLQPGEWLTLAVKSVTGTPSYCTGSVNTREDQ